MVDFLRHALPDTYTLVANVEIAHQGRPPYDFDLIVLAPHALYVVEIKQWRGGIRGDDTLWTVGGGARRPNPFPNANNKARVLKGRLTARQPAADLWVQAVVAIADEQSELDIHGAARPWTRRYTDLPALLTDRGALPHSTNLRPLRGPLENDLRAICAGRRPGPRRIGDYEVIDTLLRRDHVTEYLARNTLQAAGPPARLRVFSYDPYLAEADRNRRMAAIRREVLALQQIGPHPNLIAAPDLRSDPLDPNLIFTVNEWTAAGTLRDELATAAGPLPLERVLALTEGMAAGLASAHTAGVIHRDLRPEHVLIGPDGAPRLMAFDHARLPAAQGETVGPPRPDPDVSRAYLAPELLNPAHAPTPATDLYGLGVILFEMLTGATLFDTPEDALRQNTSAGGPRALAAIDIPERLNALVAHLCQPDPARRPQAAAEVLAELRALRAPTPPAPEPASPVPRPPTADEPEIFQPGNIIAHKFQVRRIVASGGFSTVYQVYDEVLDRVTALKLFKYADVSFEHLKQEALALRDLRHKNVARLLDWGIMPVSHRPYLLSEFVDGEELTAYTRPERRLGPGATVRAILSLLDTLAYLHGESERLDELEAASRERDLWPEEGDELQELKARRQRAILHRDIKPANLILTADGEVNLVDFNIATSAGRAGVTQAGTPSYMLPEAGLIRWSVDADLFAAGIVLYELITGHHPYPDRQPSSNTPPADPTHYAPDLGEAFAALLRRAVSCDPNVRYHSARRFRADLAALDGQYTRPPQPPWSLVDIPADAPPNTNPFVTHLLTLYSQARRDNSGTRGLGLDARRTYVATRLDRHLQPAVMDGRYRLVIITGNAGDGKTAFIQNLERQAADVGTEIARPTRNSSRFVLGGVAFTANYDGSQDEGAHRANDAVLREFFAPFADDAPPPTALATHLIAINTGRLLDFFLDEGQTGAFSHLAGVVNRFFDTAREGAADTLPNWLCIIDLNYRSIVAADPEQDGRAIFDRQLDALVQPALWASCASCALRDRCFIRFNRDTLADPVSGPAVRKRLRTLFEVVHLRRKLHITMRDMRSALSWLLARDHSCADVAELLANDPDPECYARLLFHNAFADDSGPDEGRSNDRLVRLLRQIDPAQVSNPADDRALHFGTNPGGLMVFEQRAEWPARLLDELASNPGEPSDSRDTEMDRQRQRHALLRRRAYFERRDDQGWQAMLPYRQLETFQKATRDVGQAEALKPTLARGLSRAEGAADLDMATHYVCLRAGRTDKARVRSFRLFPVDDFGLRLPTNPNGHFLEYAPDQLLFRHQPSDPTHQLVGARPAELVVSLDVLELLALVADGSLPSPDDASGVFVNLTIFKNALAHLPYRRALLTRDNRRFYEVALVGPGRVRLRAVESNGEAA